VDPSYFRRGNHILKGETSKKGGHGGGKKSGGGKSAILFRNHFSINTWIEEIQGGGRGKTIKGAGQQPRFVHIHRTWLTGIGGRDD